MSFISKAYEWIRDYTSGFRIMIINSKFGSNFLSGEEKMLENIYDAL